jgi:hypothetical protein
MEKPEVFKLLRQHGLPTLDASKLAATITAETNASIATKRKHDWPYVLLPLTHQIRLLQSSKHRWHTDTHRAKVYGDYLSLLITIKKRINQVKALNLAGESIPEIAAKFKLPFSGMRWQAWVKPKEMAAHTQAFFTLYTDTLDPAKAGRRMIPFSTREQRSVSDKRWDMLRVKVSADIHAREMEGRDEDQQPLLDALKQAQRAIDNRDITDEAPYAGAWERLLDDETRNALDKWYADSIGGLDLDRAAEAAREDATKRMQAAEKREAHKAEMNRQYAEANRRARGVKARKKNETPA